MDCERCAIGTLWNQRQRTDDGTGTARRLMGIGVRAWISPSVVEQPRPGTVSSIWIRCAIWFQRHGTTQSSRRITKAHTARKGHRGIGAYQLESRIDQADRINLRNGKQRPKLAARVSSLLCAGACCGMDFWPVIPASHSIMIIMLGRTRSGTKAGVQVVNRPSTKGLKTGFRLSPE